MANKGTTLAVVGAGVIGSEFATGALEYGINDVFAVDSDFAKLAKLHERDGRIKESTTLETALKADIIVVAIKPQNYKGLIDQFSGNDLSKKTILSVMAGIKIETLKKGFPNAAIVRVMPNLPVVVREGILVWKAETKTPNQHRLLIKELLSHLGEEVEVKGEYLLDLSTAISGSGPGFVYLFMEALQAAGVLLGADAKLARRLVVKTILGTAKLADKEDLIDFKSLRKRVTSEGGTTQAGIDVLEKNLFQKAVIESVKAAKKRGQELSSLD